MSRSSACRRPHRADPRPIAFRVVCVAPAGVARTAPHTDRQWPQCRTARARWRGCLRPVRFRAPEMLSRAQARPSTSSTAKVAPLMPSLTRNSREPGARRHHAGQPAGHGLQHGVGQAFLAWMETTIPVMPGSNRVSFGVKSRIVTRSGRPVRRVGAVRPLGALSSHCHGWWGPTATRCLPVPKPSVAIDCSTSQPMRLRSSKTPTKSAIERSVGSSSCAASCWRRLDSTGWKNSVSTPLGMCQTCSVCESLCRRIRPSVRR